MALTDHRLEILALLADTISERRKSAEPEKSYTAKLLAQGMEKCAKKLGEEAVEAALAAMTADRQHLTEEMADVLYHMLVLLEAANLPLAQVMSELEGRLAKGALAEKARRGF